MPECFHQFPLIKCIMKTNISRCQASKKLKHLEELSQTYVIYLL